MSKLTDIAAEVARLTESQRNWIEAIIGQFKLPHKFARHPRSDLVSELVLQNIGDLLRVHHAMSRKSLNKTPFEYAFEKALQLSGVPAKLAESATNPGYDLTIGATRISLKTEGAKNIKEHFIHVSKWMEAGKGLWDPLNIQFLNYRAHLTGYDRILTLRCLAQTGTRYWYELVEIPKALMLEAHPDMMQPAAKTKQETSPWYCRVNGPDGLIKYELYFDAGAERKLQVKKLRKDLCFVHATWKFYSEQLTQGAELVESEDDS